MARVGRWRHLRGKRKRQQYELMRRSRRRRRRGGPTLLEQLSAYDGLILLLDATVDVTLSGGDVVTWGDQTPNGYDFTGNVGAGTAPEFSSSGWSADGGPVINGDGTEWLRAPDNDDFSVGSDSWLVVAAVRTNSIGAYKVYFGNGDNANNEGFRCFLTPTGPLQIFMGKDSAPGTGASGMTVGTNTEAVCAWCVDRDAGQAKYATHADNATAHALTAPSVADVGNPMAIFGEHDGGYAHDGGYRIVAMFRRPAAEGFSNAEIDEIVAIVAAHAGL